ncbi:MAG: organic solvent tolerance protein OstA-like protein, partial [Anaeromyxobacteraceae bacterium]|nr:organic solvent tolerance protein OstA-like protein [Anaeromyxobacteraceae bacterium]
MLLLVPGAARGASASLPGPVGPVDVEAGLLTYDAVRERFLLEDGVRLRRGAVLLRARTGSYDPRTGEVDATGDVLLTGPG